MTDKESLARDLYTTYVNAATDGVYLKKWEDQRLEIRTRWLAVADYVLNKL